MIEEGDHIAVGISGGKDSLTLLYALHGLKRFYPKKFELSAITVDLGYRECDFTPVVKLCEELNNCCNFIIYPFGFYFKCKIYFNRKRGSCESIICYIFIYSGKTIFAFSIY